MPVAERERWRQEVDLLEWQLLRSTHNAILLSPDGERIAKIHSRADRAGIEASVARGLGAQGVPVARLLAREHPHVTVWKHCGERAVSPCPDSVAHALALLHQSSAPLPVQQWLDAPLARLHLLSQQPDPRLQCLLDQMQQLHEQLSAYSAELGAPAVFLHGDAAFSNMLVDNQSSLCLIDWETVRMGPREWDMASLEMSALRFGLMSEQAWIHTRERYEAAAGELDERLLALCRGFKELSSCSWAGLMIAGHPRMEAELQLRLATLRGESDALWSVPLSPITS